MGLYLIMMGVQGAGKGTQAGILAADYGIPHVSTGDMFRAMKHREDDLAQEVQRIMKAGDLVSDELTCRIVEDRLKEGDAANGVILDGFPRNQVQADWLNTFLEGKGEHVTAVVNMELDLYVAFKRAYGRVTAADNGTSYNVYYNVDGLDEWSFMDHPERAFPPRLEGKTKDGQALKRRPDDANAHAVVTRIDKYIEATMPLIEYYEQRGLVVRINADQAIESVTQDIKQAVETRQK